MSKWVGYPTIAGMIFFLCFFLLTWPDETTTTAEHVDQVPLYYVLGARFQYLKNPDTYKQRLERAYQRRKQNGLYNQQRETIDKDLNGSDHPANPSNDKEEGTKPHRRRHHHHRHRLYKPEDEDKNGGEQTKNEKLDEEGKAENEEPREESDHQDNDHSEKREKHDHEEDGHKKSHIDRRSPENTESVSANEVTEKTQSWTSWIFGETAPEEELEEAEFVSSLLNENIVDEFQTASTVMAESTDEILQDILQESSNLIVRRRRSPDDRLLSSVAMNKEAPINEETAIDQNTADEQESSWWWWFGSKPKKEDVQAAENVSTQLKEDIVDELTLAEPSEVGKSNSWLSSLFNYNYGQGTKQEPTGTELATTDGQLQSPLSGTELATTDDQLQSSLYNTYLSPYSMLRYMLPEGESTDIAMNLLNMYSDPENTSYWKTAMTFVRIMLLFMPAAGIVEQVNFSIAMTQILWKVSTMYYEGYSMSDIAVKVLPELASAYLFRRDETYQSEYLLKPGQTVDIHSMDTEEFVKFTESMQFPPLLDSQEEEIKTDVSSVVNKFLSRLSKRQKDTAVDYLTRATKFLALLNPVGELKTSDGASSRQFFKDFKDVAISMKNRLF